MRMTALESLVISWRMWFFTQNFIVYIPSVLVLLIIMKVEWGCTVMWWLAPSPNSKRVDFAWVLSGYSGFLPPSKNMHVMLIGNSKLFIGVSVSVHDCVFRLFLCGPVMDWRPVQGVPSLSPDDRWDRLQPPPPRPDRRIKRV